MEKSLTRDDHLSSPHHTLQCNAEPAKNTGQRTLEKEIKSRTPANANANANFLVRQYP
jgi:hypothetical protein